MKTEKIPDSAIRYPALTEWAIKVLRRHYAEQEAMALAAGAGALSAEDTATSAPIQPQ